MSRSRRLSAIAVLAAIAMIGTAHGTTGSASARPDSGSYEGLAGAPPNFSPRSLIAPKEIPFNTNGLVFTKNEKADLALIAAWRCLYRTNYKDGIKFSEQAIKLAPTGGHAYLLHGYCLFQYDHWPEAIAEIKKGLKLLPDNGRNCPIVPQFGGDWTYHVLGQCYLLNGQESSAVEAFKEGRKLYPLCPTYDSDLGHIDVKNKKLEDAIANFSKAIAKGNRVTLFDRASCYMTLKKGDLAVKDLTMAIAAHPDNLRLYNLRAQAYRMIGKNDLAKKDEDFASQVVREAF